MQEKIIYAITDYNGLFGSKHNAVPYKSGMDKDKLTECFKALGYELSFLNPTEVNFSDNWTDKAVIYSSQEDPGYVYKDFLEDIILGFETRGANVIPSYKHLRANNNKAFMHILEEIDLNGVCNIIPNKRFSTLSELKSISDIIYPVVIKLAAGAMSKNVELANNFKELVSFVNKNSVKMSAWIGFKEFVRSYRYDGYTKQDLVKNKFVLQEFIPHLDSDYKVLKFGDYFYILNRSVRENDFRASGSGHAYKIGSDCNVPEGTFELVESIAKAINTPTISVDIAVSEGKLYVMEYQSIYFGTSGHHRSDVVYVKSDETFKQVENNLELEHLYAHSIIEHLKANL